MKVRTGFSWKPICWTRRRSHRPSPLALGASAASTACATWRAVFGWANRCTRPTDRTWEFLRDLNVRTLLNMVRAVVPHMIERGGGRIVNVGAYSALKGQAGMGAYCAAKSEVIRITEAMAAELRDKNININCVLPTIIDTPENRAAMPKADASRWVAPADLANVIVFLTSDSAHAIHGAAVPVTGLS